MNDQDVRRAAYEELVGGLIDARDRAAEDRFDAEMAAAVRDGRIDSETARTLRWWQRESLRAVIDQAAGVVPPTMVALETTARELRERALAQPTPHPSTLRREGSFDEPGDAEDSFDDPADEELPPPADLTARRLLVAGLRPLRDP